MNLADRLKILRGNKSQAAFASLIGISQSSVTQYEKGRLPDAGVIESICTNLGVTSDWLIFGKEPCSDNPRPSQPESPLKTELPVAEKAPMSGACLRCRQLDEKLDKANEKADTANERLYEAMRENSSLKEQIGILSTNLAAFKKCYDNEDDGETGSGESEGGEIRSGEEEPLSFLARAS